MLFASSYSFRYLHFHVVYHSHITFAQSTYSVLLFFYENVCFWLSTKILPNKCPNSVIYFLPMVLEIYANISFIKIYCVGSSKFLLLLLGWLCYSFYFATVNFPHFFIVACINFFIRFATFLCWNGVQDSFFHLLILYEIFIHHCFYKGCNKDLILVCSPCFINVYPKIFI